MLPLMQNTKFSILQSLVLWVDDLVKIDARKQIFGFNTCAIDYLPCYLFTQYIVQNKSNG